jgi:universal stress protein E
MKPANQDHPLRILAALDLTERSERAFKRAVKIAEDHSGQLSLLHVIDKDLPSKIADAHSEYAVSLLQDHATRARSGGLKDVTQAMVHGHSYETIIEQAGKTNADLIVLGTHGERALADEFLGTTVDRVLRTSGRPVLLVRQPSGISYGRILVAIDFSEACARALDLVLRLWPDAEIIAINATGKWHPRSSPKLFKTAEPIETRRLALKAFIAEAAKRVGVPHSGEPYNITELVEYGWPEAIIPDIAKEKLADLIVTGTHARTGLMHFFLGSVAEEIMILSHTDVLAVPPSPLTTPKAQITRDTLLVA